MVVKQRIPDFISTSYRGVEHDVNTLEELEALPWLQGLKKSQGYMGLYCSPRTGDDKDLLMYLYKDEGQIKYYVIGFISGRGSELGLEDYNKIINN